MKFEDEVWVVLHQLPRDYIVAIYRTKKHAKEHEKPEDQHKHATIIYPCARENLKNQSGYHSNVKIRD